MKKKFILTGLIIGLLGTSLIGCSNNNTNIIEETKSVYTDNLYGHWTILSTSTPTAYLDCEENKITLIRENGTFIFTGYFDDGGFIVDGKNIGDKNSYFPLQIIDENKITFGYDKLFYKKEITN